MTVEEFVRLPVEYQRSYLKHPVWDIRCSCRQYGLPWTDVAFLGDDNMRHTREVCAPNAEFL